MKELIQIKVNSNIKSQLKEVAKSQGLTLNGLMCVIINDYLKKVLKAVSFWDSSFSWVMIRVSFIISQSF